MKRLSYKKQLEVIKKAYSQSIKLESYSRGMCGQISRAFLDIYNSDYCYCIANISKYIDIFTYENMVKFAKQGYIPEPYKFGEGIDPNYHFWWDADYDRDAIDPIREQVYLFLIEYLEKRLTPWKRIKLAYKRLL